MFQKCNTRQIISHFCSFYDRQVWEQLQNKLWKPPENISLQNKLSSSQMELKAQLQKATEEIQTSQWQDLRHQRRAANRKSATWRSFFLRKSSTSAGEGEGGAEKNCCICWYPVPSDLHTGCTPTRGEMCSCGSWTCDKKKGWSATAPSTRASKQRGEHQEGALSADEELRGRARQRSSSPAAGGLPQPSLHIFLSPSRRCQMSLKQAVFLFTAAEQWEEQSQAEEEGTKTSSSSVELQNYSLLIRLSLPHPDFWPLPPPISKCHA